MKPVKNIYKDAQWLKQAKGKAVRIAAPLLPHVPGGNGYRVIFIERHLDEILDSQKQMLIRRGENVEDTPGRRARLKEEYSRMVQRVRTALERRPQTRALFLNRDEVLDHPESAAEARNRFLGRSLQRFVTSSRIPSI